MGNLYNVDATTGNIATAGSIIAAGGISSTSTTSGFLPPRLTTAQRNLIVVPTLVTGLQIFNTDTVQDEFYNGSAWVAVGAGTGTPGGSNTQIQFNDSGVFGGLSIGVSTTPIFNNSGVLSLSINTPLQIISGALNLSIDGITLDSSGAGSSLEVAAGGITNTQINASAAIAASKLAASGSNTQIQFNNAGTFGSSSSFTFASNTLTVNTIDVAQIVLDVGGPGGNALLIKEQGQILFYDSTNANNIFLRSPTTLTGSYPIVLPTAQGGASTFLQNDGSGNTSWVSGGSGSVTIGTAGNMTLYPTTGTSVSDTYVQNAHNVTIGIQAQPSRSTALTYVIPNPGNAKTTTNFITTDGFSGISQQINTSLILGANGSSIEITSSSGNAVVIQPASIATTSRTYTLPDAGASADFVLDQGNYTITGNWTFAGEFTLGGGHDLILANSSCSLVFNDSGSNHMSIEAPGTITSSYSLVLPPAQGAASTFLQNDGSGNLSWAAATGSTVTTVTTTFTAATAKVILANATGGAFTVTLPAVASSTNVEYTLKKIDSSANAVTFKGNASETIDGTNTKLLNSQYQSLTVVCDGTTWWVI